MIFLFRVSRPRFWLYLGGTYILGVVSAMEYDRVFFGIEILITLVFFLPVANLLLYGVNDLFDRDTDKLNPKKGSKEHRLANDEVSKLFLALLICLLVSGLLLLHLASGYEKALLALFLFLSLAYSTPPLRFKARILIDSASNVLYVLPGFLGYVQIANEIPPLWSILSAFAWTTAMHLFSAIPDIVFDEQVGLRTTAVWLGRKKALVLCMVLWGMSSALFVRFSSIGPTSFLSILYALIPAMLFIRPSSIERIYWWFPWFNTTMGLLMTAILLMRLYSV